VLLTLHEQEWVTCTYNKRLRASDGSVENILTTGTLGWVLGLPFWSSWLSSTQENSLEFSSCRGK